MNGKLRSPIGLPQRHRHLITLFFPRFHLYLLVCQRIKIRNPKLQIRNFVSPSKQCSPQRRESSQRSKIRNPQLTLLLPLCPLLLPTLSGPCGEATRPASLPSRPSPHQ